MVIHHRLPRRAEALDIEAAHLREHLVDVAAALLLVQAMEQHALLHRRQRIDVGDLRRGQRQAVQLRLVEAGQREVRWRHPGNTGGHAVLDQVLQFLAVGIGQGLHGLDVEHFVAETPRQFQRAIEHLAVDRQQAAQRRLGALAFATAFARRREQRVFGGEAGIQLAEVVEDDLALRQRREAGLRRVAAQVAQHAVAEAFVRHGAQLFLDRLDRRAQLQRRGQLHRVQAGEPADGAGGVEALEEVFAAVAFQAHQRLGVAAPATDDAGQRGEQQVVDLGAVGRRGVLQQLAGQRAVQVRANGRFVLVLAAAVGTVQRQCVADALQLRLPPAQFLLQRRAAGEGAQVLSPDLDRMGLGRQRGTVIGRLQVLQQNPPGHTVHCQVMNHQQQALFALRQVDQQGAQQRAVLQVEAALCLVGQFSQLIAAGQLAHPQQLASRRVTEACAPLDEAQAQRIVMHQQCLQGRFQRRCLQVHGRLEQHRLVPVMTLRNRAVEEPMLNRHQRGFAGHWTLLDTHHRGAARHLGDALHGLALEQVFRAEHDARLTRTADHLNGDDRVAAQLEEVVGHADLLQLEDVGPDRRQLGFQRIRRRDIGGLRLADIGLGQRTAVQLAVGAQRHFLQQYEVAGDHELGQMGLQMRLERVFQLAAVLRHQIRRQLLAAWAVDIDHAGFADGRVFQQTRFDFTQFDAQTANLHLMVDTAGVFDHALVAVTRQVAGAVEAAALGGERIRYKAFGSQRRTVVVTASQTDAAQIQLGGGARRGGQQAVFEDVGFQVVDWLTDRNAQVIVDGAGPVGDVDRRLGRAVQVVQAGVWQAFQHLSRQLGRQCFTAANDAFQRGARLDQLAGHECLEHRRHEVQRADAVLVDGRHQTLRVTVIARQCNRQTSAGQQRPEELPHRHVEAERGLLQHGIRAVQTVSLLHPVQAVDQGAMAVARPFRLAGGARGVDHVGEVFRHAVPRRVGVAVTVQIQLIQAKRLDIRWNRQTINQRLLGQQQLHATVLDHVRQTVLWIIRVQRHISTAGLDDRHQANDHFQAALDRNTHQRIRANAQFAQFVSELVGAAVDLGVAQLFTGKHQRRSVRRRGDLRLDQALDARLAWEPGGGGVPVAQDVLLLGIAQQRQLTDTLLRIGNHAPQQVLPMLGHARDGVRFEQRGGVGQRRAEAVVLLDGVEHQVELRGVLLRGHPLQGQPGQFAHQLRRLVLVVVHHLEQRAAAQVALGLQRFHQLLERQVLMGLGLQGMTLDLLQQRGNGGLRIHLGLEHLGVDEEADQAFGFGAVAVGDRHADTHIAQARIAVQQGLQRGQQEHEQGHALRLRQPFQARGQFGVQL